MKSPESYIFRTAVRFLFFLINLFAVYLLLRGHNLPGGGFIGGLVSAISLVLLSMAVGLESIHRLIRVDPARIAAAGLCLAILSGCLSMTVGDPFLTQYNWHLKGLPLLGDLHFGTPLLFDTGVYLVVIGICCKIIFILAKSTQGMSGLVAEEQRLYSSVMETPVEGESPEEKEDRHAD